VIGGQRGLQITFTGKYHQTDAVLRAALNKVFQNIPGDRDSVGLEVFRVHAGADIQRQRIPSASTAKTSDQAPGKTTRLNWMEKGMNTIIARAAKATSGSVTRQSPR